MIPLIDLDLALYMVVGGAVFGFIATLARATLTWYGVFLISLLYYFCFTGGVNLARYFNDTDSFYEHVYSGVERAILFGISAAVVVHVAHQIRRRSLLKYMRKLESDIEQCHK